MDRSTILLIAGFGDNASMFDGLLETPLADEFLLQPLNLPGFGAPRLGSRTTLESLARFVADKAKATGATILVAHSVASIIASLAAKALEGQVERIVSLEGNLTADDAYFSGSADNYDDAITFRDAFLVRLDGLVAAAPSIVRYRKEVEKADHEALWELGRDARRFSESFSPGQVLLSAAPATYLYNPKNCPASTIKWIAENPIEAIRMPGATHWASVAQPDLTARKIGEALAKGSTNHRGER